MDLLLAEIERFCLWAQEKYPGQPQSEIGGEWEVDYCGWNAIISAFEAVVNTRMPDEFTVAQLDRLVYIIARDNECEALAGCLRGHDSWLFTLCQASLGSSEPDARWQLALLLKDAGNQDTARYYLERFVQDPHEYVCRRALMELPRLLPRRVEEYAGLFWDRDCYGDMQEYQRIAVLDALEQAGSPQLAGYLEKAENDGRKHLAAYAEKIRRGLAERCKNDEA